MAKVIKMPDIGTTVDQIRLVTWLKQEGETVARGEPLCEVETDKAVSQLESVAAGVLLRQVVSEGSEITEGTVIGYVGKEGESVPEKGTEKEKQRKVKAKKSAPPSKENIKVSPMIRNLAKRSGIDLEQISGTGPGGLITREDVLNAKAASGAAAAGKGGKKKRKIEISSNQLSVAKAITKSHREIVTINLVGRIGMARAIKKREELSGKSGTKVLYDAVFLHAVSQVVKDYPHFQCFYDEEKLISEDAVNIGVTVSIGEDLFIPVIKSADGKSIVEIDKEIQELVSKAEKGSLGLEEMSGATFTISNLGMYPVQAFSAIIPPEQCGILAIGRTDNVIRFDEDSAVKSEPMATVTLSVDHRFINGREAAMFLTAVKEFMENL